MSVEGEEKSDACIARCYTVICYCFVLQKSSVREKGMWLRRRKVYQDIYEAEWNKL
jgi:hypothetical protein